MRTLRVALGLWIGAAAFAGRADATSLNAGAAPPPRELTELLGAAMVEYAPPLGARPRADDGKPDIGACEFTHPARRAGTGR